MNSFTDYSSIDWDRLTDSSNKWQQNDLKNEEEMINDIDDNLKAKQSNNIKFFGISPDHEITNMVYF